MLDENLYKPYRLIKTKKQMLQVCKWCKQTGYASIDFETKAPNKERNGFQYDYDEPTILGISFQAGSAYILPLFHKESPISSELSLQLLQIFHKKVLRNVDIIKIAYNAKFEYKWLKRYNCQVRGRFFDPMLAKYLLDEERPNDLKSLVANLFPEYDGYEDEVKLYKKQHGSWADIPLDILCRYNALDCSLTMQAFTYLEQQLIRNDFYKLFRNMYGQITYVLGDSEYMGMLVDKKYLSRVVQQEGIRIENNLQELYRHKKVVKYNKARKEAHIQKLVDQVNEEIEKIQTGELEYKNPEAAIRNRQEKLSRYIAGQLTTNKEKLDDEVNFNSPNQLIELLFNSPHGFKFKVVKYTQDKKTKRETTRPSTDEEVLLQLKAKDKSGFIDRLLKHREMVKLYSTYLVGMKNVLTHKSRVHTNYLAHGTVTGRLSSREPNLQNIPRDTTSSLIKRMFIAPPGLCILEVDYSQAELRVVAEMSDDEAMIEIFKRGFNIHLATGLKISGYTLDDYSTANSARKDPEHPDHVHWTKIHKKGKVTNFSILYLQSDQMTAEALGVSVDEAAEFKAEWFRQFPRIKEWMEAQWIFLHEHGFVRNLFGQKRRLPDIWSDVKGFVNKAKRDAVNAPIQGSSAQFTNFATIQIRHHRLYTGEIPLYMNQLYTVHDSIGFYIRPKDIHRIVPKLINICANPETEKYFGIAMKKVEMKVSAEIGISHWGEKAEYDPNKDYVKLYNEHLKQLKV